MSREYRRTRFLRLAVALSIPVIGCGLFGGVVEAHARAGVNSVRLADGKLVTIPDSGPLADQRATDLANDIVAIDDRVGRRLAGISDPEIREAVLSIVVEARNVAADKLDLAYRVAMSTSAGVLDQDILRQGADALRKATDVLSRPPTKVRVRTQISSLTSGYALEYVTAAQYRRKEDLWLNYTYGQEMRYGDYVFRLLRRSGDGQPMIRRLEIRTDDPTVQVLEPVAK